MQPGPWPKPPLTETIESSKDKQKRSESHMGGCQNYGPLLGPLNTKCRIIKRTQKGTIVLTTTHIHACMRRSVCMKSVYTNTSKKQRRQVHIYIYVHGICIYIYTYTCLPAVDLKCPNLRPPKPGLQSPPATPPHRITALYKPLARGIL